MEYDKCFKGFSRMTHCVQFKDVSLNPFKTVQSLGSRMRMIYDANMEAIMQESICHGVNNGSKSQAKILPINTIATSI